MRERAGRRKGTEGKDCGLPLRAAKKPFGVRSWLPCYVTVAVLAWRREDGRGRWSLLAVLMRDVWPLLMAKLGPERKPK